MQVKGSLWDHQKEGVRRALQDQGYMLAMDMGTGKTRTTLGVMAETEPQRTVILAPKTVVPVWPLEFCEAAEGYGQVVPLVGPVKKRIKEAQAALRSKAPVTLVINYEAAWRKGMDTLLLSVSPDLLVMDESHRIKAPGGKASRYAYRLAKKSRHRLCLTGTPMPHSPMDLYAQYRAMDDSVYGSSFTRFRNLYAVMGGFEGRQIVGIQNEQDLYARFWSRAYRVRRDDVLDLPGVTHNVRPFDLSPKAKRVYRDLSEEFVAGVEGGEITAANALVKLLRLQQVTGGVIQDDEKKTHVVDEGKAGVLRDLLEDIPTDEPVVVFARFHSDLETIAKTAVACGRSFAELSGRKNQLAEWQAGDFNVLGAQMQAGGVGVDMRRAAYIAYYSVGFSLGDYEQSLARSDRAGQTRKISVYHLVANDTVDRTVYRALQRKADVVGAILGEVKGGSGV